MELINGTNGPAAWTLGFQADGRELLIVVVKATYKIPQTNEEPTLTEKQVPLIQADEFTGEPGLSATRYESDYAHRKPFCNVLLNGSAYAPRGEPVTAIRVGLEIGPVRKRFNVIGNRFWDKVLFLLRPSSPDRFARLPISYDRAYGGTDRSENKPGKVKTYLLNPVGIGYYPLTGKKALLGKALPNTCELGRVATSRKGRYSPMAFGSIGRNHTARLRFAGTYDKAWLQNRAPFWPDDFDYRYFQCAPPEQQMPHLVGGEEVTLENLMPEGMKRFRIPQTLMPVTFLPHRAPEQRVHAACDTLLIEPDEGRFMLTWRTVFPLRRNMFELRQVIVGEIPRSWYRARRELRTSKRHYASLEELIQAKRATKA